MSELHEIAGCHNLARRADVLFLHGLWGDPFATWRYGDDAGTSWPHWLGEDFPDVGVWSLGYAAGGTKWTRPLAWLSPRRRDAGHAMALPDRARQVLDQIAQRGLGQRPLMLVCHSLGGLLAKQILRRASEATEPKEKAVFGATRAVLFVATPHAGTPLASLANAFGLVFRATVSVEELRAHDAHLRDLLNWYRNHSAAAIRTVTYFETRDAFGARIVNETSSHPGVGADPVGLDEDHLSIAKPRNRDAQLYRSASALLRDHVLPGDASAAALAPAPAKPPGRWDFVPAAALAGMTRYGPTAFAGGPGVQESVAVRSWEEFSRIFGGTASLVLGDGTVRPCYSALAANAFFANGGLKLYVSRVYAAAGRGPGMGFARCTLPLESGRAEWRAAWPGSGGNLHVTVSVQRGPGVVYRKDGLNELQVRGAEPGDVLEVLNVAANAAEPLLLSNLRVVRIADGTQIFLDASGGAAPLRSGETASLLRFTVALGDEQQTLQTFEGLSANPASGEFVGTRLARVEHEWQTSPMVCLLCEGQDGSDPLDVFFPARLAAVLPGTHHLVGGDDGAEPSPAELAGVERTANQPATGLRALGFDDIAFLLMPDAAAYAERALAFEAASHLVAATADGFGRIAIVDPPRPGNADGVLNVKDRVQNKPVAVFCPWLEAESPGFPTPILLPPSGFIAGRCCARSPLDDGPSAAIRHPSLIRVGAITPARELALLDEAGINVVHARDGVVELTGGERMANGEKLFGPVTLLRHLANCLRRVFFREFYFGPYTEASLARFQADAEAWLADLRHPDLLDDDGGERFSVRCEVREEGSVVVTLSVAFADRSWRNLTFLLGSETGWWQEGSAAAAGG